MEPKSRIFEGKTLEEAVRKGLEAFGLSRAEVMITTMQEGSGGFFGLGGRPFKVRIQPRPGGAPRDVEERGPRSERGGRDRGGRGERDRGGRGGRDRGGRGGDRERAGRGDRERGGAPVRAEQGRGGRQEPRREPARQSQTRGPERERGGRGRGGSPERERGGSPERERGGSNERERGGTTEREARRETPPAIEEAPQVIGQAPPAAADSQPPVGARGFEDRRRPGDRREEPGDGPRGVDRRSGEDRRQMMGAGGGEPGGEGRRRRRRGRRGGRGRRRGGAEIVAGLESAMPPAGPATAEAMASDLPTEAGSHEPERFDEPSVAEPTPPSFQAESAAPPAAGETDWDRMPSSWAHVPPTEPGAPVGSYAPAEPRGSREPREAKAAPTLSGEELAATSRQVTDDLFKAMGFEGKVTATLSGPDKVEVVVEVKDEEELLTGRKGETRQALQHLLNRMVNKGEGSRYHLQLEINDFWKRREIELAEMARSMAERAATTGQEQVSDFLNAQERRIIHVALREDARVKTYALGDGMIKRLAVAPAHAETMGGES